MRNLYINILFSTILLVYGEKDCCRNIGKSKAALLGAINTLQRTNRLLGESSPISSIEVAFHARLKSYITLGSRQTVIFDQLITNIGQAYSQHTGHFTAPYDGIYFFACTFLRPYNATVLHLQMVKNISEISRGHAASGGGSQTGAMNAIVYLHKEDVVKVRHFPGFGPEIIHGDWSFFMGYRI